SGTSSGGPASNCQSRCVAKATSCQAPASDATAQCQSYCASATESDLTCVEKAACQALVGSNGKCPSGSSSSSSSGSNTSSSSSSSSGSTPGCHTGCLSVSDCGACDQSNDGSGSYPLCCDKGSTGNAKTCRNKKCCLNFGDECTGDSDCCSNDAYKCKDNGAGKTTCTT